MKNRTILKRAIEKDNLDRMHMREVIDFVFENWDELVEKLKLVEPRPSIGLVFSGYFETLSNLQRAGFSSHSLKHNRSDFNFEGNFKDRTIES